MPKQRAFVKYTQSGDIIPGSMILTAGSYPSGPGLYREITVRASNDSTTFLNSNTSKKAWVRYTKSGNIVAGSLIIGYDTPKDGAIWREVTYDMCCIPSSIIPVIPSGCGVKWANKNLDVAYYRNGDPIPQVSDPTAWVALTTGAWCYYNNDSANGPIYGKLYNHYAVSDPRGLAPLGYHVSTLAEWSTLETCLGGSSVAGGFLKEAGTSHWTTPNTSATDSIAFTALPGGFRGYASGIDVSISTAGAFWTADFLNSVNAGRKAMTNTSAAVGLVSSVSRKYGYSVRLVKDI
jgi:uncharacterized protein (TIGR02145 family)